MRKKVSIIIATYNHAHFIGRCLRSLLSQTMDRRDYEILVVNDASTDNTDFALALFIDPNDSLIRVINNKKNLGLPASLNIAIKSCQSEYIVRVDSDDFVNHHFLNFLYQYLKYNQKVDAVACDYFLVEEEEEVIKRVNCDEEPIACGILFRKKHIIEIGMYDENFRCHEEREFRKRFEKKFSIKRLDIPLYRYRRHKENLTNNIKLMNKYETDLLKKHGNDSRE